MMWIKRSMVLAIILIVMCCSGCSEKNTENITQGPEEIVYEEAQNSTEWNNKGVDLFIAGRFEEALQAYDKATELDPQNEYAWHNKGNTLAYMGRYEEALQAYNGRRL